MKSNKKLYFIAAIVITAIIVLIGINIFKKDKEFKVSNPELFKEYITAYTGSVISKNDVIKIQFTQKFMESVSDKKISIIKTYPEVKGTATWTDDNTIEFKPDEALESGMEYFIIVDLEDLCSSVSTKHNEFVFKVHTKHQHMRVQIDKVITTDRQNFKKQDIVGKITLNDSEDIELIKTCITAELEGDSEKIEIEQLNNLEYSFAIRDITRTNHKQKIKISYNASAIGSTSKEDIEFEIPALDKFKIIDIQTHQFPEQYINIIFSDPIKEDQLLDGLIDIAELENLKYIIIDNNIKIIPSERLEESYSLEISTGVKNIHGKRLNKSKTKRISFKMRKPELIAAEDGVILPSCTEGQVISFMAVNIKAVDVRIMKIHETNVLQFLQVNSLNGSYQLDRVGSIIATKTISLEQTDASDFSEWNTFYLQLDEIIEPEPGAIYRIEIGFRKENTIYPCNTGEESVTVEEQDNMLETNADKDWDWFTNYTYSNSENYYYDDYYYDDEYYYEEEYDYSYDYNYNSYEDPCKDSYYGYRRAIKFNILASDIGLIAKMGKDNLVYAFVSDLLTTDAVQDAEVEIYNYEQQVIGNSTTDIDGKAIIELNKNDKPHFMVASYNNSKTYLKMKEYNSLSTSEFDVSGAYMQDGAKAFI